MERYLTRATLKKLFYTKYPDQKDEDSFLKILKEEGLQVGELAKNYFPEACLVESMNYPEALEHTGALLARNSVSIFEAAVKFEDFFVRIDILNKKNNNLELIEVKSKSYREGDENKFHTTTWKECLYDVAFQKYVLQLAYPNYSVNAYLMLVDEDKSSSIDGLFGKGDRKSVTISPDLLEKNMKEVDILTKVCVDSHTDKIIMGKGFVDHTKTFSEEINFFSQKYKKDEPININE